VIIAANAGTVTASVLAFAAMTMRRAFRAVGADRVGVWDARDV